MFRLSRGAVALGCWTLLVASSQARAEPLRVALVYDASGACLDAREFKSVVAARLGYDPFAANASRKVLVQLRAGSDRRGARIAWMDDAGAKTGEQTFFDASRDCLHLARAVGFALAVQIDLLSRAQGHTDTGAIASALQGAGMSPETPPPEATAAPREDEPPQGATGSAGDAASPSAPDLVAPAPPAPEPPPESVPLPSTEAPVVRASATPLLPRERFRLVALGAGGGWALGIASQATFLGRVFSSWEWKAAVGELALELGIPSMTRRSDGAGYSQQDLFLGVSAGPALGPWQAQVLAKAGATYLKGDGIDRPQSGWVFVAQTGLRLGVTIPWGDRLFLSPHADGLVALSRWTARLDQTPVWTSPRLAAVIGLDLGVRLP